MIFLLLLATLINTTTSTEYQNSIREANKQRVLLQQIVKEYSFVVSGIYRKTSPKKLADLIELFEENQARLANGDEDLHIASPPTFELLELIEHTDEKWNTLLAKFDDSNFTQIMVLEAKINANLEFFIESIMVYTRQQNIFLPENIQVICNQEYLSERLVKEVALFMLSKFGKMRTIRTKDKFQESIKPIFESEQNLTLSTELKDLWQKFDNALFDILAREQKSKGYLRGINELQTKLRININKYKEVARS